MYLFGISLDDAQVKSIKDDSDVVLVSAGAGSGKTQTILGKVKYLIEEKNIKEDEILCISLTGFMVFVFAGEIARLKRLKIAKTSEVKMLSYIRFCKWLYALDLLGAVVFTFRLFV